MKLESIYYSYKNKSDIYYLTASAEESLMESKNKFIQTLTSEQINLFSKLEKLFSNYKEALIKEIIHYSITYHD